MPESPRTAATPLDRFFEAVAAAATVVCVASLAIYWQDLPAVVPVHFAWNGRPDGGGPRGTLVAVAGIAVFMYGLLSVLTRVSWRLRIADDASREEQLRQYAGARTMVAGCKAFTSVVFAWTMWRAIQTALGRADGIGVWFGPAVVAFAIALVAVQLRWSRRARRAAKER